MPHYKGLTKQDFLAYALTKMEEMKYFPNEKDLYLMPRDYLINVINSIEGDAFREWMTERIEKGTKSIY